MTAVEKADTPTPETAPNLDAGIHALMGIVFKKFLDNPEIDNVRNVTTTAVLKVGRTKSNIDGMELSEGEITFRPGLSCSTIKVYIPKRGVLEATRFQFSSDKERDYWKAKNDISFTPKEGETVRSQEALILAQQALGVSTQQPAGR